MGYEDRIALSGDKQKTPPGVIFLFPDKMMEHGVISAEIMDQPAVDSVFFHHFPRVFEIYQLSSFLKFAALF
jgi:hypothetical protein